KVATKTSATSASPTTAFSTTYGVYTTAIQAAGEYVGKVKYVLVHPNTAPAPPSPVVTNPGYISYNPNADGVTDSMGDQAIATTDTSADLWASNFQRSGYGFAGWTDKVDWALNQNDQNGNGTGSNAGYHIYGPNETISFTAGQYSGDNPGLSLYAVWVPSQGNLQGWTGCSNLSTGQVTALTDTRDNQTYAVAKLKDNKCWMIENLRLNNQYTTSAENIAKAQGYHSSFIGLANPETTNFTNSTTANSLYSTDGSTSAPAITGSNTGYRFPRYNNQNTLNPATNMTVWDNSSNTYSVGNYYTWAAAIADTTNYTSGDHNTTSICPTGWHLPSGGNKNNAANSDFWKLSVAVVGAEPANTSSQTLPYYAGTEGANASNKLRSYPSNLIYSGYFENAVARARSVNSVYYSGSVFDGSRSYVFLLYNTGVYPGDYGDFKYDGISVRCSF
ncbi:hypothetical protein IKF20_03065, partial [Candidatus Saccharibacteria bacterium]|nr:hypothetical protein [Candidatus Saccharibacteria bacterium]MBR3157372.1 hypothetical protein [Candidatus Saccharibacteria bacterium]